MFMTVTRTWAVEWSSRVFNGALILGFWPSLSTTATSRSVSILNDPRYLSGSCALRATTRCSSPQTWPLCSHPALPSSILYTGMSSLGKRTTSSWLWSQACKKASSRRDLEEGNRKRWPCLSTLSSARGGRRQESTGTGGRSSCERAALKFSWLRKNLQAMSLLEI